MYVILPTGVLNCSYSSLDAIGDRLPFSSRESKLSASVTGLLTKLPILLSVGSDSMNDWQM